MIRISAGRFPSFVVAVVACFLVIAGAKPAGAVIIAGANGTINTTAPMGDGNDPGFSNVLVINGASGVYLGDGWVLTAYHVSTNPLSSGSFTIGSQTFTAVSTTVHRLQTQTDGFGIVDADLILYQVKDANGAFPNLQPLTISTQPRSFDDEVLMIGNGRNRAANETFWTVSPNMPTPTESNPNGTNVWTEVLQQDPHNASGYKYGGGQAIRWGRNKVASNTIFDAHIANESNDFGWIDAMATIFNPSTSMSFLEFEAQAAPGDSGGGVFYNNNGVWELTGLMHAVHPNSWLGFNQPGSTAVFGNATIISDLSAYHEQIMSIIPEPRAGILAGIAGLGLFAMYRRRRQRPLAA